MSSVRFIVYAMTMAAVVSPVAYAGSDNNMSIEFSGYYKNLFASSRTLTLFPPQQPYAVDLNRLRLEMKGNLGEETAFNIQYDNEVLLGDYLKTNQFLALKNLSPDTYFNLRSTYKIGRAHV